MATLCKTFPSPESVLRAAEALVDAGVPASDIGVLLDRRDRELRTAGRAGGVGVGMTDGDGAGRLLHRAHVPDGVARRLVAHIQEGEAVIVVQLTHVDLGTAEWVIAHTAGAG